MKSDKLWLNDEQYQQWRKQEKSYKHLITRISKHFHSAKAQGVVQNDFTVRQWLILCWLYDNRCVYCGKVKNRRCAHCGEVSILTIEHLVPYSQGGQNTLSNIVPACHTCNFKKRRGPLLPIEQPLLLVKVQLQLINLSLVRPQPMPPGKTEEETEVLSDDTRSLRQVRLRPPKSVVYRSKSRMRQIDVWIAKRLHKNS